MFIPYPARVKQPTLKVSPEEKRRRAAVQADLMVKVQAHADMVAATVISRLSPSMEWSERYDLFKSVEAEIGKVPTGGDPLVMGGYMPLFRQDALRKVRNA